MEAEALKQARVGDQFTIVKKGSHGFKIGQVVMLINLDPHDQTCECSIGGSTKDEDTRWVWPEHIKPYIPSQS